VETKAQLNSALKRLFKNNIHFSLENTKGKEIPSRFNSKTNNKVIKLHSLTRSYNRIYGFMTEYFTGLQVKEENKKVKNSSIFFI
jgi:hypothetical protein